MNLLFFNHKTFNVTNTPLGPEVERGGVLWELHMVGPHMHKVEPHNLKMIMIHEDDYLIRQTKSLQSKRYWNELELTGDKIVVIPQHVDVFHDFILIVGILYTLGSFRPSDPIIFKETLPNPLIPYCGLDSTTWQQKAYVWTNWKALRSKMVIQFNTPLQDATMCSHAPIPKDLSVHIYVREEPAVRCRWTGRVWEITGRSSRLQQIYQPFQRNL